MASQRTLAIAGYYATALVGSLVIWVVLAVAILRHAVLAEASTAWMLTAAYAAAMAWALWFTWRYWRRLDEAAREAQKFAWFFGSILALILTAPVMLFFRLGVLPLPHAAPSGVDFALGWVFLALCQLVGFLIAWAGWWWARR
jgi:hypothetical protein